MHKAVATLKQKRLSSASARSRKGKHAKGKKTTGKHDGQIQSQAPMVSALVALQEDQLVSLVVVSLEGLLVAMAPAGQLEPHRRDLAVARRTPLQGSGHQLAKKHVRRTMR